MKAALLLLPFILSFALSYSQDETIEEIRFESFSRGYQKTLILRPDSILLREMNPKTGDIEASRAMKKEEWKQLQQAASSLALAEIPNLRSPTRGRAADRALHSTLTIKTRKGEYRSPEFDGYHPHKALLPLAEQIRAIENKTRPSESN